MEATVETLSAYEIERGKPLPDFIHAVVQANLTVELRTRCGPGYRILSELDLATTPIGTTPDVAIYPWFELDYDHRQARRTDAPLCCIEIQSPSQSLEEMVTKTHIYFQFGVRSCWVVQPAIQGILVFDRPGHYAFFHGDGPLRDEALGVELPLAAVFA